MVVKTAISLPDDAFERIEQAARRAGVNRSEFFVTAALRYIDLLDEQSITERVNDALSRADARSRREGDEVAKIGRRALASLTSDDEDW